MFCGVGEHRIHITIILHLNLNLIKNKFRIYESHATLPNWNSPGIATPLLPPELLNYLQMPEKKTSQSGNGKNPRKKSKRGKEVSKYVNAHKLLLDKVCLLSEK